jgi:large subunit ribosomal protein L35e
MNTNQKDNLRKFYAKRKYKPLDLRPKLTRAKRRELTRHEKKIVSRKVHRKRSKFPARKFALKA